MTNRAHPFTFDDLKREIKSDESHPSISKIIANTPDIENVVFHDIKEDFIIKQINKINIHILPRT
jgi:hypothetical protein